MGLIKKIGTALAITALSAGLMHNVMAEPSEEVKKEVMKYANLFMIENKEDKDKNQIVFRWRAAGEEYNVKCIYDIKQMKNKEIFLLRLKKAYEDRNRNGKFSEDEIVEGKEYKQFKIMGVSKDFAVLGKDLDNDAHIDRTYNYFKKHESPTIRNFILHDIKKSKNGNLDGDEIIWSVK